MKYFLILMTAGFIVSASAERWPIGETISIEPTAEIDVTFQVFPDYDPNEPLVHGWKGDDLQYLLISDQQPGGKKQSRYWKGMLKEIKSATDDRKVNVLSEGSFSTESDVEISYKVMSYLSEGEVTQQMMNLVVGDKYAYWLIASPFSEDIDYMVSQTKALLKSLAINE